MANRPTYTGLLIALLVIGCWALGTVWLMEWPVDWANPLLYLFVLIQMHLYTGLFITAHDAMHGTVTGNHAVNSAVGYLCTFLYAGFWYPALYAKHHAHHRHVHTMQDPDYYQGSFWLWYFRFMRNYLSVWQIIWMAVLFNILKIWIPQVNLLLFWVAPALLSTLQLFYFGTYLPHRGQHRNRHQARSQRRNHLLAFFSCYFFGYHYEHHATPGIPWWRLWQSAPPPADEY